MTTDQSDRERAEEFVPDAARAPVAPASLEERVRALADRMLANRHRDCADHVRALLPAVSAEAVDEFVHISDRTAGDTRPICWYEYAGHDAPCTHAGPERWQDAAPLPQAEDARSEVEAVEEAEEQHEFDDRYAQWEHETRESRSEVEALTEALGDIRVRGARQADWWEDDETHSLLIRVLRGECVEWAEGLLASDWLAARDRAAEVRALRAAAEVTTAPMSRATSHWLRDRADRIEGGDRG